MGRKIVMVLLVIGAVFGFAAGIHSWRHPHGHWARHEEFERRVADVCVSAAQRVLSSQTATTASPP